MAGVNPRAWADVVGVLITDLNASLTPTVYPAVPASLPSEFVVVRRTGGAVDADEVLDRALVDIEVWSGVKDDPGQSLQPANALAATVREALRQLPDTSAGDVMRVIESGVAQFPDPETQIPRVIITATVIVKPTDA